MAKIVCFGEIMMRLGAPVGERLGLGSSLVSSIAGAEANVAVMLARLGNDVSITSVLPHEALGDSCLSQLRSHGIETAHIARAAGRLGLYFLEPGAMMRPSRVVYDRANTAFSTSSFESFDWHDILSGADWFHVSGITLALGPAPAEAALLAIQSAREMGINVSLDCNYRANLWDGQEEEMARRMREMVGFATCLFAGRRDARYLLEEDFTGPDPVEGFSLVCAAYRARWPQLRFIASTHREVMTSDRHRLIGRINHQTATSLSRSHDLEGIVDRIGGGDAFAGGLLDRLAAGANAQQAIDFATASAALKHTILGDLCITNREEIQTLLLATGVDVSR